MVTEQAPENWISGMEQLAQAGADFRAQVAPGTQIGSEQIGDSSSYVNYQKSHSKIKMGGQEMPDRIPLWNSQANTMRMVPPTIAQARIMKGTKQYPASAFSLRDPGLTPREPIDATCPVCDARRANFGQPPRRFFDEAQLDAHFEILHPRAFRTAERRRETESRATDQAMMRELIGSIRDALVGKNVTDEEAEAIAESAIKQRRTRKEENDAQG